MRIAVTGSGGQLGGELCRQLGPDSLPLDLPDFDLTNPMAAGQRLIELRPDAVINTAAYTQVDRAEENAPLCFAINAQAVGSLAQACRQLDCPLVQISTDYVFGRDTQRSSPYTEEDQPGPLSVYGRSKLAGEQEAAACERHVIVRSCGLYGLPGPRTSGSSFVDTMLRLAGERKVLRVVDDQHCTPTYVPHLARAVLFLLAHARWGTYHLVNAGETTWHGFAREIFRQAGLDVRIEPISTAQYGAKAQRPGYSVLDTSKYQARGGPPMPSWRDALAEYLAAASVARQSSAKR